jgi:hypothetical protein
MAISRAFIKKRENESGVRQYHFAARVSALLRDATVAAGSRRP